MNRWVSLTNRFRRCPEIGITHRFGEQGPVLWSHRAAVMQAPPGATVLARSPASGIEALRIGRSIGVQWHPEVDRERVRRWARTPRRAMWADRLGVGETGVAMVEAFERSRAWADATQQMVESLFGLRLDRRPGTGRTRRR